MLFFAPHTAYSYTEEDLNNIENQPLDKPVTDFKTMVKELHRNGIEVILDVVFNHTAEGNEAGPTYSFKGIDNKIYYILDEDKSKYLNYSGCGNTVNCNHPVVRNLIMDSLHYWVNHMHVDGFRFDLASILGRDRNGKLMENAPLLETIAEDPLLRDIKIIAEAWDAGGAYQVGGFQDRWGEWNGKYRDDIRQFWFGKIHTTSKLATRIAGSSDLYKHSDRTPLHSINFITSHDGFTMNDLVSYSKKHNWANGELNRDGSDYDFCYNHGEEGETDNKQINQIRVRQIKNLLTTLFLSQGVPMLLGGDEFRRTQKGNNNAYCQDNKISWFDWSLLKENKDIFEFTKHLIAFRKKHPAFRREHFFTGKQVNGDNIPDISWFSYNGKEKDWKEECGILGVLISGNKYSIHEGLSEEENRSKTNLLYNEENLEESDNNAFIMFNSSKGDVSFNIPKLPNGESWYRVIDTSETGNDSICLTVNKGKSVSGSYQLKSKSVSVLLS
jgi:glycogen operon protein